MVRVVGLLLGGALALGVTFPALACRSGPLPPSRAEIENARPPMFGFEGKVVRSFTPAAETGVPMSNPYLTTGETGVMLYPQEKIVEVDVIRDFSGQLPTRIEVLVDVGWCCRCLDIRTKTGDEVATIVRTGRDGLLHLARSELESDSYELASFLEGRFSADCSEVVVDGRRTSFCCAAQPRAQRNRSLQGLVRPTVPIRQPAARGASSEGVRASEGGGQDVP
jgi:hypothetical protein